MNEHKFEVDGGKSLRLKTAGKYCDRDIVIETSKSKGALELLYTEGAEITAEDWGNVNLSIVNSNTGGTPLATIPPILGTKMAKITFPDTQTYGVTFWGNSNLVEYDSGNGMNVVGNNHTAVFRGCSNLRIVRMGENFLPFGMRAFYECISLKEIHYRGTIDKWASTPRYTGGTNYQSLPFMASSGGSFYLGGSESPLVEIELTTASQITYGAFYGFVDITKATIGVTVTTIDAAAFQNCSKLEHLILKGDTVKTLSALTALANTPIVQRNGTIWIQPETVDEATLVSEYKAATNWSTLETQIKPFSEYTGG